MSALMRKNIGYDSLTSASLTMSFMLRFTLQQQPSGPLTVLVVVRVALFNIERYSVEQASSIKAPKACIARCIHE